MDLYSPEELSRKSSLLNRRDPLSETAQKAIRCAECILARNISAGVGCFFTLPEIMNCQELTEPEVRTVFKRPLTAGQVERTEGVREGHLGGPIAKRYKPIGELDEANFFQPAPMPDCKNEDGSAKSMYTDKQLAIIGCLGCVAKASQMGRTVPVNRNIVARCTGISWTAVGDTFEILENEEVLGYQEKEGVGFARTYVLTNTGERYVAAVPEAHEPFPPDCAVRAMLPKQTEL